MSCVFFSPSVAGHGWDPSQWPSIPSRLAALGNDNAFVLCMSFCVCMHVSLTPLKLNLFFTY